MSAPMALGQLSRQLAMAQALANTRISGHAPTPEFIADCDAVVEGRMTYEQAITASLERATRAVAPDDRS
ncbi:antitoxin VbhA family protein [Variovorax boronicumulans]|uniref:antitoxin VbhA family protein n=1 Tax=Variovorax boronicumulans TaxID=436515 RepID=UPI003D78CE8E